MALNKKQLENVHMFQKLYVVPAGKRYDEDGEIEATKVSKVGSKYFYTADGKKWERATGHQITEYSGGQLFVSEREYIEQKEIKALWKDTYNRLSHNPPVDITLEQIHQIMTIVGLK